MDVNCNHENVSRELNNCYRWNEDEKPKTQIIFSLCHDEKPVKFFSSPFIDLHSFRHFASLPQPRPRALGCREVRTENLHISKKRKCSGNWFLSRAVFSFLASYALDGGVHSSHNRNDTKRRGFHLLFFQLHFL